MGTVPDARRRSLREPGGAKIYVDPKSFKYLDGTVLDCDPNMLGQSLILRNPNAKAECGCGLSFGV